MKTKLLLAMTLLLSGVGMKAQSVSAGQMDERFNDNKLPYGWFTEGWEVDSTGVAKRKASSMDMENFNIADLLGGGSSLNYLMTPPLSVQDGEVLSFSAKKGGGDDSGLGSFMGGGDSDSTFVVERAVYGEHMWIKVADFTTQLDSVYKTFTIANTEAGEYRFRFRAGGKVLIDSVAGFHVDNDAPDIYPVYQKKNIQPVDLGVCTEDTTMTFNIVNTATGTLTVNLSAVGAYTLDNNQVSVAAADTATVKLTFNYGQAHEGRNSTLLFFSTTDERVEDIPLPIDAVVPQKGVWVEDFNQNTLPVGWFTEGWEVKDSVATVKQSSGDGGMGGMFGGSSETFYLMTPPLIVNDVTDVLLFSVKKPGGGGMDLSSLMGGGGGSSFIIEKSVYGSNKWERAKEFTDADTTFTTQWLSFVEPGEYRFRFVASDSIVIDSVAGFQIDMNAPDLYVKLDSTVVKSLDFGTLRADSTSTFTVINTGTGTLDLNVTSRDEQRLSVAQKSLSVAAGDSVAVDATMIRDESRPGEVSDMLLFMPADDRVSPQAVSFHAYIIKSDVWTEDFEPYYVVEDRTFPRRFPEGWTSTGWKLSDDNSNDMMAMFGGGGGEKSWGASSDSDEYELITPRLQAAQGEVLRFDAEMGGMGGFMMMFGGGGSPTLLNVYYSLDSDGVWKYYGTYSQGGTIYFKAPYSGVYQLRFVGSSVTLDNFEGFHAPLQAVFLEDGKDEQNMEEIEENNLKKCNVKYNRVLSAIDNGDGTWTPDAYTIFLPYDMDFSAYNEPGKVQLYRLEFIDRYYGEFVFMEVGDKASACVPYLAVVLRDSVRLDAYDVKMTSQAINEDTLKVYDYEAWHTDDSYECIGQWSGSFVSCTPDDERAPLTYGLCDDGSWLKVSAAEEALPGFRAHFYASTDTLAEEFYMARARTGATVSRTIDAGKTYQTKFYQQGENGGSKDMPGLLFCGDITAAASSVTGVKPTIKTIDRDGTIRYFDLQGHQLSGKPAKGFYIENGKTHVAP